MPIPGHGPFCKTRSYPRKCKYCGQKIFFVSCTCGSAMLFDRLGWPWPEHWCVGRGASGRSGVGVRPRRRTPISREVVTKRQRREAEGHRGVPLGTMARSVAPQRGSRRSLVAHVRAVRTDTALTRLVNALLRSRVRRFGLAPGTRYRQITLVDGNVHPNASYTALIPDGLARGLSTNVTVKVKICGTSIRNRPCWVVTAISAS